MKIMVLVDLPLSSLRADLSYFLLRLKNCHIVSLYLLAQSKHPRKKTSVIFPSDFPCLRSRYLPTAVAQWVVPSESLSVAQTCSCCLAEQLASSTPSTHSLHTVGPAAVIKKNYQSGEQVPFLKHPKSIWLLLSNQETARALTSVTPALRNEDTSCCLATSLTKTAGSVPSRRQRCPLTVLKGDNSHHSVSLTCILQWISAYLSSEVCSLFPYLGMNYELRNEVAASLVAKFRT